jgi:hypothetical protein
MAMLGEDAANQEAAVAVSGVFFSANQRNAEALDAGFKPGQGRLERGIRAKPAVEDMARVVVIAGVCRTAA